MISLRYIIKEMFSEKTRLLLTVFAIAWGTASIGGMLAVGEGLRINFNQAIAGAGKSLLVAESGQTSTNYRGQAINQTLNLTWQDYSTFKKSLQDVVVTPEYTFNPKLVHDDQTYQSTVSAVEPVYADLRNIEVQPGGRFINDLDMKTRAHVIVLGNKVAEILFPKSANPVGESVLVNNMPFTVVGVLAQKFQFWSYIMQDWYLAWIPLSTYTALQNPQTMSDIVLMLKHPEQLDQIEQQMLTLYAFNHGLDPNDQSLLNFTDSVRIEEKTNQFFGGMEIFLGLIGGLTLLIAGVGVANVMFVSVKRATREIGIRMAIGAQGYQVLLHYLFEALIATALGGALGLLIVKGIVKIVSLIPVHGEFFQYVPKPQPILSAWVVLIVVIVLGLTGLLAGVLPAKRAADTDPAEALRYE